MVVEISTGKPYSQIEEYDYIIREFSGDVDESELVWHRDKETRTVFVLQGEGWYIQMDNQHPRELVEGVSYIIPKMEYHRLLKGKGNLIIQIKENNYD